MGSAHKNGGDLRDSGESPTQRQTLDPFDAAYEELLSGPAGAPLRRAHILEQLATRLCNGDYNRAQTAMDSPHPQLGGRSASDAAETHEGMVEVKQLLASATHTKSNASTGLGYFIESVEEGWRNEFEPLLDLLPAAWSLNEEQFTLLLGTAPPSLTDWQQGTVVLDDGLKSRLTRLRRLHEAFRSMVKPERYCEIWYIIWDRTSPIGARSLWEAFEQDGEAALDSIEAHFRALAGPF